MVLVTIGRMSSEFPPGRLTRKVTFTVDTPASVPDSELAGQFAGMWADAPVMTGWWVSLPEVTTALTEEG